MGSLKHLFHASKTKSNLKRFVFQCEIYIIINVFTLVTKKNVAMVQLWATLLLFNGIYSCYIGEYGVSVKYGLVLKEYSEIGYTFAKSHLYYLRIIIRSVVFENSCFHCPIVICIYFVQKLLTFTAFISLMKILTSS